jgi:hypothetical protein
VKARVTPCRKPAGGCGEPIVFLCTRNKALMPVDVDSEDDLPEEDDIYRPGRARLSLPDLPRLHGDPRGEGRERH